MLFFSLSRNLVKTRSHLPNNANQRLWSSLLRLIGDNTALMNETLSYSSILYRRSIFSHNNMHRELVISSFIFLFSNFVHQFLVYFDFQIVFKGYQRNRYNITGSRIDFSNPSIPNTKYSFSESL